MTKVVLLAYRFRNYENQADEDLLEALEAVWWLPARVMVSRQQQTRVIVTSQMTLELHIFRDFANTSIFENISISTPSSLYE